MLIHTACRLELNEWLQADGIGRRGGLKPIRPAAQPGTRMSGVRGRRRALAPHTFDVLSFGSPTWHRDAAFLTFPGLVESQLCVFGDGVLKA
jgi:hypothetical protein